MKKRFLTMKCKATQKFLKILDSSFTNLNFLLEKEFNSLLSRQFCS